MDIASVGIMVDLPPWLPLGRGAAGAARGDRMRWVGMSRLASWALCLALLPAAAAGQEAKTLKRRHDAVVLAFDRIPVMVGKAAARLRLYRSHAGHLQPIPYQIDVRDDEGEYAPSTPNQALQALVDANDELAFMARDTGDRAARAAALGVEIEVRDPLTDERGWVYLIEYAGGEAPPRSLRRYVSYDIEHDDVAAESYEIGYRPRHNFFRSMRILPSAGGSGENLLQRMTMLGRPVFSVLSTRWSFDITEDTTRSRVVGVTSGPVRIIRRTRLSVDLGRYLPTLPRGHIYTTHYPSYVVAPMRFSIPGIILKALHSFDFESVTDFNTPADATRYWDEANPHGVEFGDGVSMRMTQDHEWWAVGGPAGTYLQVLFIPERWKKWGIARGTVVRSGESRRPIAGYSLLNMANMRAGGTYELETAMVILSRPYEPGDEQQPMAIFRAPLEATARPCVEYAMTPQGAVAAR